MWQKCQICNGSSKHFSIIERFPKNCTVCNGIKIISEISGLLPNFERNKTEREDNKK